MSSKTLDEQLTNYLTDAHSIEEQALQQLRSAPEIAGHPQLAAILAEHCVETERQERLVRERLEARGARPSRLKDAVMRAGGAGFVLFAGSQPDTPGKLASHAYSYEHLELAGYELLMRVAERAGDAETVSVAQRIRDEEQAMADRLEASFDATVDASLDALQPDDMREQLVDYLSDAHAIEAQARQLLERGPAIVGESQLARLFEEHLHETIEQQRLLEQLLDSRGGAPNRLKDAGMRLGALNWGTFFQAQRDTPGKLTAFAFAFEHLEIGGYEQLARVARRMGDEEAEQAVERIIVQERAMAERLSASFDRAAEASLEAVGAIV